jgi:hypothetical protein
MEQLARYLLSEPDPLNAEDAGVKTLIRVAQADMSQEDQIKAREEYLSEGCSTETADKLFPDLPLIR